MRIEKIKRFYLGLWAGVEDELWLELGFWAVRLGCEHWDWVDRGGQWSVRISRAGIWWNWGAVTYPPRRFGVPFLGRP